MVLKLKSVQIQIHKKTQKVEYLEKAKFQWEEILTPQLEESSAAVKAAIPTPKSLSEEVAIMVPHGALSGLHPGVLSLLHLQLGEVKIPRVELGAQAGVGVVLSLLLALFGELMILTVQPGSNGTSTITAAVSGGFNGAIALSSSGEPSGVTASFSPTSIPAPGSGTSTMTLAVSSSAVAGTYTINVIGTGTGGVVENTTVSLTVSSASTNLIVNGGFETGTFSGWTAGGPIEPTVTKAEAQSGSYSALLGRTAAPEVDGNSAIYQAITIPSTASKVTLTFSYWPGTNDSIQYAYQDAMILNSSGNRLATVLEVSSNARSWQEVTYDLTSYKGKTILVYFGVHGDGYEPDHVYMYLDNVSVTVQ